MEESYEEIRILKDDIEEKEKQADNDWRLYKQTEQRKSSVKNYHFTNRFEKGEVMSDIVKKRLEARADIEELNEEIRRLKDNIEGKEKQADNDWRIYKQIEHKKYFFTAKKKYAECNEMKSALCEAEKEYKHLKNEWNRLKKAA